MAKKKRAKKKKAKAKKPAKKPRAKKAKRKAKAKAKPRKKAKRAAPSKPPIPRALDAVEQAQRAASGVTSSYLKQAHVRLLRALGSTVAASKPRKSRKKRSTSAPAFAGF